MNDKHIQAIGDEVAFGKRSGHVIGYTTFKRISHSSEYDTYLIVELDHESCAYLEKRRGYEDGHHDVFIGLMVIHPSSARRLNKYPMDHARRIRQP